MPIGWDDELTNWWIEVVDGSAKANISKVFCWLLWAVKNS